MAIIAFTTHLSWLHVGLALPLNLRAEESLALPRVVNLKDRRYLLSPPVLSAWLKSLQIMIGFFTFLVWTVMLNEFLLILRFTVCMAFHISLVVLWFETTVWVLPLVVGIGHLLALIGIGLILGCLQNLILTLSWYFELLLNIRCFDILPTGLLLHHKWIFI